jgi:hypothetical protein
MYLLTVVALMAVLPILSIGVEAFSPPGPHDLVFLVGKWFVFWASGVRLAVAGLRQMIQPEFTAREIFATTDAGAAKIARELGFGNFAIGVLCLGSIAFPGWRAGAALCSCIFYGLAGLLHVGNHKRNRNETIAMISDLAIFVVLVVYLLAAAVARP